MRDDQHRYLNGLKRLWREQKNPIWVWIAIKTSFYNKHSLPNWVCNYLEECADQLLSPSAYTGDFARKLPRMLGFSLKSGPKHQLKVSARMLKNEQFAMKFAKHILNGKKPSDARKDAANECGGRWPEVDDKVLQTALRQHFKVKRAPTTNRTWKTIVTQWMIENLYCYARYPDLPRLNVIFEQLAAIPRDYSVPT